MHFRISHWYFQKDLVAGFGSRAAHLAITLLCPGVESFRWESFVQSARKTKTKRKNVGAARRESMMSNRLQDESDSQLSSAHGCLHAP